MKTVYAMSFLEMGARAALLKQMPDRFSTVGEHRKMAIAEYDEEGGGIDPGKLQVCLGEICVPLLPIGDVGISNLEFSTAIVKKMALNYLDRHR